MPNILLMLIIGVPALVVTMMAGGIILAQWEDHKLAIEATKPAHDDGGDVDDD